MNDTTSTAARSSTTGTHPDPGRRPALARFVTRHPVATFLLTGVPLALGLMSLAVLAQFEILPGKGLPARVGLDMEEAASVLLVVSIFLSTLAVTAVAGGRAAVRVLFRRMTRWHVRLRWWLVAAAGIPAVTVALALLMGDTAVRPSLSTLGTEAGALLVALVGINLWEEAVWAGFMQTHLERTHAFVTAAALTAVPFAAVHMPLRLITGEARTVGELLTSFVILTIFVFFARSVFGIVLRGSGNSILLAAVTHTMFNRSNNVDGLVADVLRGPNRQFAALLSVVLLAAVLGIVMRRRLTRSERRTLDQLEMDPAAA